MLLRRSAEAEASESALRWTVAVALGLARHPSLWAESVRTVFRLSRPHWWRQWPPLPLPDARYVRFRAVTNTGSDAFPVPEDVLRYVKWCRSMRRSLR